MNILQRQAALRELMSKHDLSCEQVAKLLNRKLHTVHCWRTGPGAIPELTLDLLSYKVNTGAHLI